MNTTDFVSALASFTYMADMLSKSGLQEMEIFLSCEEGRIAAIGYLQERLGAYNFPTAREDFNKAVTDVVSEG